MHYEANPYEPLLHRDTPMYWKAQCLAEHVPGLPHKLRKSLKKSVHSDKALKEAGKELIKTKSYRALIGTTQAIDLISGGVKTNALPEQAWAVVNHRIATDRFVFGSRLHPSSHEASIALMCHLVHARGQPPPLRVSSLG